MWRRTRERVAKLVALTCIAATRFVLVEDWVFRRLAVPSGSGFWMVLLSVVVASYVVFSRLLWHGGPASRRRTLRQIAVAGILAVTTYVVAINASFAIATSLFGAWALIVRPNPALNTEVPCAGLRPPLRAAG